MNLLEGIAKAKSTNSAETLGRAIDGCNCFPHEAVRASIKDLYGFASDYPGLRHDGNQRNKLRDLKLDDASLTVLLSLAFGSFVYSNDACSRVLEGDF